MLSRRREDEFRDRLGGEVWEYDLAFLDGPAAPAGETVMLGSLLPPWLPTLVVLCVCEIKSC